MQMMMRGLAQWTAAVCCSRDRSGLHPAHRLTQRPDEQPTLGICCLFALWPRVDPEQASAIAGPHFELGAAADFCLVCDVVRKTAVKHLVGGNLSRYPCGLQFFQNYIPQLMVKSAKLNSSMCLTISTAMQADATLSVFDQLRGYGIVIVRSRDMQVAVIGWQQAFKQPEVMQSMKHGK